MYMLSPPWVLPLLYPLGLLSLQIASILWALLECACFAISVHMLWQMHGRQRTNRHYLGYSFAPALICLIMGQITTFALLGVVLFLRFHKSRPLLGGMALWLCALKPHLFLPLGVVVLAWAIVSRHYRLLLGAVTTLAASITIALPFVANEWSEYLHILRNPGANYEFSPCISVWLRELVSRDTAWLQYLPAAFGCLWALAFFWRRRSCWDWQKDGSLVMLVSLLVAPHTYLYDQVLAIPALLDAAYRTNSRNLLAVLAVLSLVIELLLFGMLLFGRPNLYSSTLWTAPAWIAWYLMATARSRMEQETATAF
jgi:hypothetical protein